MQWLDFSSPDVHFFVSERRRRPSSTAAPCHERGITPRGAEGSPLTPDRRISTGRSPGAQGRSRRRLPECLCSATEPWGGRTGGGDPPRGRPRRGRSWRGPRRPPSSRRTRRTTSPGRRPAGTQSGAWERGRGRIGRRRRAGVPF